MNDKIRFALLTAALFLFVGCGSSQPASDEAPTEQAIEEATEAPMADGSRVLGIAPLTIQLGDGTLALDGTGNLTISDAEAAVPLGTIQADGRFNDVEGNTIAQVQPDGTVVAFGPEGQTQSIARIDSDGSLIFEDGSSLHIDQDGNLVGPGLEPGQVRIEGIEDDATRRTAMFLLVLMFASN